MADRLNPGESLTAGGAITSQNGQSTLTMQGDGNLVLYRANGRACWATSTDGNPGSHVIMQGDGNFVNYDLAGVAIWATATDGHPGAWLIIQDDGNLVIYDSNDHPLWASDTVVVSAVVPNFMPSASGFHFSNANWSSVPDVKIDVLGQQIPIGNASNGLCGGMVFAVRDYFEAGIPIWPDTNNPSSGVLFDYIVKRLIDSFDLVLLPPPPPPPIIPPLPPFGPGPATYMWLMNPALPDHETVASSTGLAPHGRAWVMINNEWPQIKAEIDSGHPSPIALVMTKSSDPMQIGHNHQVLAYGYDLDWNVDRNNILTIYLYDPNYPGENVMMSLMIDHPENTTTVTYSKGGDVYCFFRPLYTFSSPPPYAPHRATPVHTPEDYGELYGQLRAQVLSRFFAYKRYFRANHLSMNNHLGLVRSGQPGQNNPVPPDKDDLEIDSEHRVTVRPSTYADAAQLLGLDPDRQEIERWRVSNHDNDNPLMYESYLMTALAIEHKLGVPSALPILRLAIESIGYLFKFESDFAGYPIRWDPVTSDNWVTRNDGSRLPKPVYCYEFLLNERFEYLYCTPFNHPAYVPYDPSAHNEADPSAHNDQWSGRQASLKLRNWEVSMDELVGLVLTYDMVFSLVDDATLRAEIRKQVSALSSYLARNGYLLVRPCGGFTSRGASGILPTLEYAFGRVFSRITGQPLPTVASFEQALVNASIWDSVKPYMQLWGITGTVLGPTFLNLLSLFISPLFLSWINFINTGGSISGYYLGRAAGVWFAQDCFDVNDMNMRREFPVAYLFKLLPARDRFLLWINNVGRVGGEGGSYSRNFYPFIGLTALHDANDQTVRNAYLSGLNDAKKDVRGRFRNTGFAAAVAVALGESGEESNLRNFIDDSYEEFAKSNGRLRHPSILDERYHDDEANKDVYTGLVIEQISLSPDNPMDALEYMACLALSWLRAKQSGTHSDVGGIIPLPTTMPTLPAPFVPQSVIMANVIPALGFFNQTYVPQPINLFPEPGDTTSPDAQRPADPPSAAPPVVRTDPFTITVPESATLVDPNIQINRGDGVSITAYGTIWAGVWLTGTNGPDGWDNITNDAKFPRPGTNPFCLLYKVVPEGVDPSTITWQRLGTSAEWAATSNSLCGKLIFRTNDDTPGNGSGTFVCDITIRRAEPGSF